MHKSYKKRYGVVLVLLMTVAGLAQAASSFPPPEWVCKKYPNLCIPW